MKNRVLFTVNGETFTVSPSLTGQEEKRDIEILFRSFVNSIPKEYHPDLEYIKSSTHITGECVPFGIMDFQIRITEMDIQEAVS